MQIFEKVIDKWIESACETPILGLVFANLNKIYFRKYIEYTIFSGVFVLVLSFITAVPVFGFFFLCMSLFLIYIGLAGIYSERFRQLVLNSNNSFKNTIYILYFFIYVGILGVLLSGFIA